MNTYYVTEKQNINSTREAEKIQAKDLTHAKRKASRMQAFHGTVLEIEDSSGATVAVKYSDGKWATFA